MVSSFVGMVILLGGLIFFHEMGHYLVAKFFKVRVEVFSLGFGKKIFSRVIGETEYALSIVPLGGYVKLMGDDPYKAVPAENAARAFSTQKLFKRFLIVSAGPIANLILAFVIVLFVLWYGEPEPGTKIGSVTPESPAFLVGLRPNDRIRAVDEKEVATWDQIDEILRNRVGQRVSFRIERLNQTLMVPYEVVKVRTKNFVGQEEEVGGLKGALVYPFEPLAGVSNPGSPAGIAGLRTGDLITKIDSSPIHVFEDINSALMTAWSPNKPVTITVKRSDQKEYSLTMTFPNTALPKDLSVLGAAEALGIFPSELFVRSLAPGSAAEKGGILVGDRLAQLGKRKIVSFDAVVDEVQAGAKASATIAFRVERGGKILDIPLTPVEQELEDPLTHEKYKKYMVGIVPQTAYHEPEIVIFKIRELGPLLERAFQDTRELVRKTVLSIVMLVTGKVSVKNLGGPLLIASVAGKSLDIGVVAFLKTMALISINLFLLNLLPVPLLDGGHLFFYVVELFKGKPVSVRTMEIATQIGMALILMLVGLTLFNDVYRLVAH
ncbi:MAG: RIP metalloprotease RseP [Deltaproteobacteria bacterium]|nr:RIP metalloprotease RseP [Deltaproteobacteria bacterium]MBI3293175.1 RIP metalloprotease RseP [Deltaproteobacteria bacterium]